MLDGRGILLRFPIWARGLSSPGHQNLFRCPASLLYKEWNALLHGNFLWREVVSVCLNPQAWGPPIVGCPRLCIELFATSLHIWRPGWTVKVTVHLRLVRRLRTSGAIPPFPHTPSQGKSSLSRHEIMYVMVYNPAAQMCKRSCRLHKALLLQLVDFTLRPL